MPANVCPAPSTPNNNAVVPGAFQDDVTGGTLLALRVGAGGAAPLREGYANPLFFDEVSVGTGATLKTIAVPTAGALPVSATPAVSTTAPLVNNFQNLACTLSVGTFWSSSWNRAAGDGFQYNPNYPGPFAAAAVPGQGDGKYPLWYYNREGLPSRSWDGRFVTIPCYNAEATPASGQAEKFLWGSDFGDNTAPTATSISGYHHKVILSIDWAGNVVSTTRARGDEFFYGPLLPEEPQYITSAVTTGTNFPFNQYTVGNSGDNGEGTMIFRGSSISASKSGAPSNPAGYRISNTPGYFECVSAPSGGGTHLSIVCTLACTGAPPLCVECERRAADHGSPRRPPPPCRRPPPPTPAATALWATTRRRATCPPSSRRATTLSSLSHRRRS
jgi:hypothetical protein